MGTQVSAIVLLAHVEANLCAERCANASAEARATGNLSGETNTSSASVRRDGRVQDL